MKKKKPKARKPRFHSKEPGLSGFLQEKMRVLNVHLLRLFIYIDTSFPMSHNV